MTPQDIVLFLKLKAGYAVEAGLDEQVTCAWPENPKLILPSNLTMRKLPNTAPPQTRYHTRDDPETTSSPEAPLGENVPVDDTAAGLRSFLATNGLKQYADAIVEFGVTAVPDLMTSVLEEEMKGDFAMDSEDVLVLMSLQKDYRASVAAEEKISAAEIRARLQSQETKDIAAALRMSVQESSEVNAELAARGQVGTYFFSSIACRCCDLDTACLERLASPPPLA